MGKPYGRTRIISVARDAVQLPSHSGFAAAVHPNGRLDGEPQRHFRLVGALDAIARIAPRGHPAAENAEGAAESASSATFLAVPANQGS